MNSFGRLFRINIFGESHGDVIGVLVDGVKPGIKLKTDDFKSDLNRRKPSKYGTSRIEEDEVLIKSGVFNDYTTGAPILIEIKNNNKISKDYENLSHHFRPGHADFTANQKYHGFNDYRGGGSFSGRLTAALICAGVIADKVKHFDISSKIINIGGETLESRFNDLLEDAKNNNDSIGGIVRLTVTDMPKSLGEPYFDSLESYISHLLFSVPAVKGVSFGVGFDGVNLRGSSFNDLIIDQNGKTSTNNNGGINGGISNGNDITIDVMIKPTPSIGIKQQTFDFKDNEIKELEITGRHDSAIIMRVPVVLEAVLRIALLDLFMINKVVYND